MLSDIDLHRIKEMAKSEGWKLVMTYCQHRMAAIEGQLSLGNMDSLTKVTMLQGEFRALRNIINQFNIVD